MLAIVERIRQKLQGSKPEPQPDEGLKYRDSTFIRIDGNVYPLKLNSIHTFQMAAQMQEKIEGYAESINSDPTAVTKLVEAVKDFVLMMVGQDGYNGIFDTAEKKDNWEWHLQVFSAIFSKTIEYKMDQFQNIVNSPVLDQVTQLQEQMNREQRRAAKKAKQRV